MAWTRRVEPRSLETNGSVLNNRRRILRRGLPYGDSSAGVADSDEHGIVMLAVCASLFRQFEFVQQQWINYGLDSHAGSDTCPIVGNHSAGGPQAPKAKFVIPADPKSGHPPFIVRGHAAIRRNSRRRLFLRAEHDSLAHDRHGRHRPDLSGNAMR